MTLRRWLVGAATAAAVMYTLLGRARKTWADGVDRLVDALTTSRSFKVRVQAASLLARSKEPRAYQALGRAAVNDPHPAVRSTAVRLLGRNPGGDATGAQQARLALGRALADRDPGVRRQANVALALLERNVPQGSRVAANRKGPTVVAVGHMGDRTGRAKALSARLRSELERMLAAESGVQVQKMGTPGVRFLIDGTISKFSFGDAGRQVEVTCGIELVVSRPPRGITTVASGEATVQKPRSAFRPAMRPVLESEALDHAVRSAFDNLSRFLAAQ